MNGMLKYNMLLECTELILGYSFQGSEKEVEEFEHLSPDVAKERLRKLAAQKDKNSDGKIDKEELRVKI